MTDAVPASSGRREAGLLAWTLSYLRPYGWAVVLYAVLSLLEVGLGALAPWPLKAVIDNVLGGQPLPPWLAAIVTPLTAGSTLRLLVTIALAGVVAADRSISSYRCSTRR